jgi:phage shock protein E
MTRKPGRSTSGARAAGGRSTAVGPRPERRRLYLSLAGGAAVLLVAVVLAVVALSSSASRPSGETVVQGHGGTWTNVTADRLAQMLDNKDFTLVNVKTPYIGEIDGTDLAIPYDQLGARAAELPTSRAAKILVYCRSGAESAQAAQTLLDLGYTNVWNLDGGMNAWTSSGRTLIQRKR